MARALSDATRRGRCDAYTPLSSSLSRSLSLPLSFLSPLRSSPFLASFFPHRSSLSRSTPRDRSPRSLSHSLSLRRARSSCVPLLLPPSLSLSLLRFFRFFLLSVFCSFPFPLILLSLSLPFSPETLFSFPPTVIRSDLSRANEPDGSFYSWSTRSNENTALRDFFTLSLSLFPPRGFLFRRGHDKAAREISRQEIRLAYFQTRKTDRPRN